MYDGNNKTQGKDFKAGVQLEIEKAFLPCMKHNNRNNKFHQSGDSENSIYFLLHSCLPA
jgi:hypothetical protein